MQCFFKRFSQLDARDPALLQEFMDNYRNVKIKVIGLSDCMRFHDRVPESSEFDQFSMDLWREFYIQEDIIQIAFLEDKQPLEVSTVYIFYPVIITLFLGLIFML